MNLAFRPALEEDEAFLYDLHRAALREAVEETWGAWDEEWQRAAFHQGFRPAALQVVQLDGRDVGVMLVEERAEELFLGLLEVLPAFQRRGIGSAVVRGLAAQARREGKLVALKVLKANRRALALYQRLGFGVTGETQTHYVMAWTP